MRKLFILLQIPSDPTKAVNISESEERSEFLSIMDKAEQEGGPEGIEGFVLVSTDGFNRSRNVWPKSWHAEQAEAARKESQGAQAEKLVARLPDLLDEWDKSTSSLADLHVQIAELDPELAAKLQPDTKVVGGTQLPAPSESDEKLAALRQSLVDAGLDPEKDLAAQLAKLATSKASKAGSKDPKAGGTPESQDLLGAT